jgi:Flp pilus assembly protein TadG
MKRHRKEEAGTILIAFALFLFVLLGFCALGIEAGRWYMVRAELSKSVDAAALVAAKNISNPYLPQPNGVENLAREFAIANFPVGYLGTPGSGAGQATFTATVIGNDKVQVDGNVSATAILARLFDANLIPTSSRGVGQKKEVEIMLVLDRSGSMAGTPISRLKTAAITFVNLFQDTQDKDKMGLVSFATSVNVPRALGTNYVATMVTAINAMSATGATNTESAIDQVDGPGGFTDQTGVPGDQRIQQFMIFFSDGRPTGFHTNILNNGRTYDGVGCVTGNCVNGDGGRPWTDFGRMTSETPYGIDPTSTGPGTGNVRCPWRTVQQGAIPTTRWYIFDTSPVPNGGSGFYAPTESCIELPDMHDHFCNLATSLAIAHANELKAKHIKIYTIGLGSNVNTALMQALATDPSMYYYAPTPNELQTIFQRVAQEIKLRLVY